MLDLEDSALGDGKTGNLPGVSDHDKIETHLLISAYPRSYRPAIHVVDVFFGEQTILLFPENSRRVSVTGELDDSEFRAMGDLNPMFL